MSDKKTTVNWESPETWHRVLASLIATGVKPDLKKMAIYFGTTYDTLENRFRKIKQLAIVLKEGVEAEGGEEAVLQAIKSAQSTPRKPKTPRKAQTPGNSFDGVASGRVNKSTPTKRTKQVKHEEIYEDAVGLDFTVQGEDFFGNGMGGGYSFESGEF